MTISAKDAVLDKLDQVLDADLAQFGFARRPRSLEYKRQQGDAKQAMDVGIRVRPSYHPGAWIQLVPACRTLIPAVENRERAIWRGVDDERSSWIGAPYELLAPKGTPMFYASDQETLTETVKRMGDVLHQYLVPFLDRLTSPADVVAYYHAADVDWPRGVPWLATVAVAALIEGRPDLAREIVASRLSSPGLAQEYGPLIEEVARSR